MRRLSITEVTLVGSNLLPLFGIFFLGWDVLVVMFLYWLETAVVGFFSLVRMAKSPVPSSEKKSNNNLFSDNILSFFYRIFIMGFFVFHFGSFMVGHLVMIVIVFNKGRYNSIKGFLVVNGVAILAFVVPLFLSHAYSFVVRFLGDGEFKKTTTNIEMGRPYSRVFLIHIVSFLGAFVGPVFLLVVKTFFDLKAHRKEHKIKQLIINN